jgi:hypothetical protein
VDSPDGLWFLHAEISSLVGSSSVCKLAYLACGELFCFWSSAAAPMTVDLVLAAFGEEDADWHSTFQMQLDGVFGLLVLAAAFMCSSSSSNPTREFTGQRHRCHRPGVVKTNVSSRKSMNFANRSFWCLFANSCSFKVVCVNGDVILCKN